jgi:hypothetical protein
MAQQLPVNKPFAQVAEPPSLLISNIGPSRRQILATRYPDTSTSGYVCPAVVGFRIFRHL